MRRRRRIGGWAGALVAVMLVAGCGSSSSSGTSSTPTKAEYIARVSAVCKALEQRAETISAGAHNLEDAVRKVLDAYEQADAQLRAIPLPTPDTVPSEWLHLRETATAESRRAIDAPRFSHARAAASSEEFTAKEKARALAKAYGLAACVRT
jgi:hypothetical protein